MRKRWRIVALEYQAAPIPAFDDELKGIVFNDGEFRAAECHAPTNTRSLLWGYRRRPAACALTDRASVAARLGREARRPRRVRGLPARDDRQRQVRLRRAGAGEDQGLANGRSSRGAGWVETSPALSLCGLSDGPSPSL